jgi:hypothetical protein
LTCWVWRNNSSKSHRHRSTHRHCFDELLVTFGVFNEALSYPFHKPFWGIKITKQCSYRTVWEWAILTPQTMNNMWEQSRIKLSWFMLLCGCIQYNNQLEELTERRRRRLRRRAETGCSSSRLKQESSNCLN